MSQYFDPEAGAALQTAVDDLVLSWPAVTTRTMFGCPSYLASETIFAVLVTDGVALTRLSDADRTALEAEFPTEAFQAGDRMVTKWPTVRVTDAEAVSDLEPFLRASYEQAHSS